MKSSDLDVLLEKLPSKYAMTMAVAQRAKQLEAGARHFLEHGGDYTPITAAIEEIRRGKVRIDILEEEDAEETEVEEEGGEATVAEEAATVAEETPEETEEE